MVTRSRSQNYYKRYACEAQEGNASSMCQLTLDTYKFANTLDNLSLKKLWAMQSKNAAFPVENYLSPQKYGLETAAMKRRRRL